VADVGTIQVLPAEHGFLVNKPLERSNALVAVVVAQAVDGIDKESC